MKRIINKLSKYIQEDHLKIIEEILKAHKRHNRVYFKVIAISEAEIKLIVRQERNPNGYYFDAKRLIEIGKELLASHFEKVIVHPHIFIQSPVNDVSPEWIRKTMQQKEIGLKKISLDTGIDKTHLSALINGDRPLSQVSKSSFYFYFKSAELNLQE